MFGNNLVRKREKVVVIADIGSGSAAVAFVMLNDGGPATILSAHRSILPLEERTHAATIAGITEQLTRSAQIALTAFLDTSKKDAHAFSEVYCILRAPWSRSKTARVDHVFDADTSITSKTIESLAHKALSDDTELDKKNIYEASVIRVELNGYPTGKPVGKRAKSMSVYAVLSDCQQEMKQAALTALQKALPQTTPVWRSSTRALITLLGQAPAQLPDYVIMDMSSEGTSVIVVRNGTAAEHVFVSEGVRTILKRLSGTGMPEETLSLIRMLGRGQCSNTSCEAMEMAMGNVEPDLVRAFGESLGAIASARRLPGTLILATHPDMSGWLAKFFARIDFTQFTQTAQPFVVQTLSPSEMTQWVVPAAGVVLDTGTALGASLVHIEKMKA